LDEGHFGGNLGFGFCKNPSIYQSSKCHLSGHRNNWVWAQDSIFNYAKFSKSKLWPTVELLSLFNPIPALHFGGIGTAKG